MSDDGIICGPSEQSPLGGTFRRCTGNSTNASPLEQITPAPVAEPPAIERRVITEQTNAIARKLIASALGEHHERANNP